MFELAFKLIGILILCHFIFDYPLQGDFLANLPTKPRDKIRPRHKCCLLR